MSSSSIALVKYIGDEDNVHQMAALSDCNDLFWEIGYMRWVNYGEFLKAYADIAGDIPDYFIVMNVLYPDTP